MDDPTAKACSKCGVVKPLGEFSRADWCADGHRGQCKACRLIGGHKTVTDKTCTRCGVWKPIEAFSTRRATPDGYHQHCRDCRNAYRRARYAEDPETALVRIRAWQEANREKTREAAKRWAQANPDRRNDAQHRRRARMLTHVGPIDREAIWTGLCALCAGPIDRGLAFPHPFSKSLDHITPLSLGGSHEQSNLQWTHLRCNISKGNRP